MIAVAALLSLLLSLRLSGIAIAGHGPSTSTSAPIAPTPTVSVDDFYDSFADVLSRLEHSQSASEIFVVAEEIPAIHWCIDKAIVIVMADAEDATLAARAIYRLAQLRLLSGNDDKFSFLSNSDRRFEQLVECVNVKIRSIHILEVARYVWGLSVLNAADSEDIEAIVKEYTTRLQEHNESCSSDQEDGAMKRLSSEELATVRNRV